MTVLERDWTYSDLVEWHALTNAIERATERAERDMERELEARRRSLGGG